MSLGFSHCSLYSGLQLLPWPQTPQVAGPSASPHQSYHQLALSFRWPCALASRHVGCFHTFPCDCFSGCWLPLPVDLLLGLLPQQVGRPSGRSAIISSWTPPWALTAAATLSGPSYMLAQPRSARLCTIAFCAQLCDAATASQSHTCCRCQQI